MKKLAILQLSFILLASLTFTGCYKLQKDYEYDPSVLDPKINMTAKDFLLARGSAGVGADTVFKWMQLGLEYAGFDMAELEKADRTYIFLHNNAVRTYTGSGATLRISAGFFFDYPVVGRDAAGNVIKSRIDPSQDSTRVPTTWSEYPKEFVKNYFQYLILQGEYSFENLTVSNTSVQTLLAPGTVANPKETKLGWVVTKSIPNPDAASLATIRFDINTGTGFDPEGKMNLKLINNQNSPLNVNDRADDRTAGYFATNGKVHVFDRTIHPFRYSH